MKKVLIAFVVCFFVFGCKTPEVVIEEPSSEEVIIEQPLEPSEPVAETPKLDTIEGTYIASFLGSSKTSGKDITYAVQFFQDKSARLLIFKGETENPNVFKGKWLETSEHIIILYFESRVMQSEFFKKRADGNLSILRSNRTEYEGSLYDYMVAEKVE